MQVPDTTQQEVDAILERSQAAWAQWSAFSRERRAEGIRTVAARLEQAADELVALALDETHLGEARLRSELVRTTFQLRLLADVACDGAYLDVRIDHAAPDWPMGPRPEIRRLRVPVGPVLVFAASNFPFAFSVAGGDSAAALAAGCTVVLKAHPGHPRLSARTAALVAEALEQAGAPGGTFQIIFGEQAGVAALRHPLAKAAAFTGSLAGGRALHDIAAARPEPIPFYGELGSVNPVFVTPAADAARAEEIAKGLVGSFTLGAGQFCTKPGVVFAPAGSRFVEALRSLELPAAAPLLNERITSMYLEGERRLREHPGVEVLNEGAGALSDPPAPTVLLTTAESVIADREALLAECFGPTVLVVQYRGSEQLLALAAGLDGQLTATLAAEDGEQLARELAAVLVTKAGRLLWNQWSTGVSVTYAQQHGGPYPATTAPTTTSVGTAAIDRFTRPVAFQGFPVGLLAPELGDEPLVPRLVDGRPQLAGGSSS
jgi:NADP-dependent aldehyde dehydrogenase